MALGARQRHPRAARAGPLGWAAESGLSEDVLVAVAEKKKNEVRAVTDEDIAAIQLLADMFTEAGELPDTVDITAIVQTGHID